MKAADIPDELILEFLAKHQGNWTLLFGIKFRPLDTCVDEVITPGVPPKVLLAKMRAIYRRGLIAGCDCGCRGDWEITDKGLGLIGQTRKKQYSGYGEMRQ